MAAVLGIVHGHKGAITLDTEFPVGDFVINNDDALTNNPAVSLTNAVTGAAEMRFTNTAGDWSDGASIWWPA